MQCSQCRYWKSYGHSNRGSCEKLLKSFGLEAISDGAVNEIRTRGDFGCTEFSRNEPFEKTPFGYQEAVTYLKSIGEWEEAEKFYGKKWLKNDTFSLAIYLANELYRQRNGE